MLLDVSEKKSPRSEIAGGRQIVKDAALQRYLTFNTREYYYEQYLMYAVKFFIQWIFDQLRG